MKVILSTVATCLVLLSTTIDIQAQDEANEETVLFDGSNLDHWLLAAGSTWRIEGQELVTDGGKANHLVGKGSFDDFELNLEFWIDEPGNSGVFIRCNDLQAVSSRTCYEINIWDHRPDPAYRSGAVVNYSEPLVQIDTIDRWNTYQIRVQGEHLQIRLNDALTVDIEDGSYTDGHITLQYGGDGVVKFRNIVIKPL